MADLKKTVAIEFETNAAKAAKDTQKLAKAQDDVAKSSKKSWTALDTHNARVRNAGDAAKRMAAKQREANEALRRKRELLQSNIQEIGVYAAGVAAAAVAVDKLSQRALALDDVQKNLPFSIDKAKKASQGLVDTYTLQEKAVLANTLGAAKNAEEYEKLVQVATKLARAQGIEATEGVDKLTTALARGSFLRADDLGISTNATEAYEMYAEKLGVATSALDDNQKAEAKKFAILTKGVEAAENMTAAEEGLALKLQKSKIELIDGADAALKLANNLSKVLDIAPEAEDGIGGLVGHSTGLSNLTLNVLDLANAFEKLNDAINPPQVRFRKGGSALTERFSNLADSAKAARRAQRDTEAALAANEGALAITAANFEDFGGQKTDMFGRPIGKRRKGKGGRTIDDILDEKISSQGEFSSDFLNDSAEQENSDRISRMRDAQEEFAKSQKEAAEKRDEAEAALQENIRKRHEERLKLIEDEKRAEQEKFRSISRGVSEWSSLAGEMSSISVGLAQAQGASAEEAARMQNKFLGMQAFGRAAVETVEAAAAVARYDYAGAALHTAAAVLGIAKGSLLVSGALDPSGGGDTSGASMPTASSSGPVTTASELPDGPISRPNTDAPPQNGGQNTSPQTAQQTNVVVIENFNTLGTTPDEQANAIQQMLDDRQRKVGNA